MLKHQLLLAVLDTIVYLIGEVRALNKKVTNPVIKTNKLRIIAVLVGMDLKDHLFPTPLP